MDKKYKNSNSLYLKVATLFGFVVWLRNTSTSSDGKVYTWFSCRRASSSLSHLFILRATKKKRAIFAQSNSDSITVKEYTMKNLLQLRRFPKEPDNYAFPSYIRIKRIESIGIDEYNT